ncbi:MAG: tetratricopeptide repeat protein [Bacteroidetes bacterium]|nr:tetratricopeptide repeat protein [Bacteroidota bacterium]
MADKKGFDVENLGDELIERVEPAKEFVQKYSRTLLYVIGGVIVLIGAIAGYRYYIGGKNDEAKNDIFKLQLMFEKDSLNIVLNGRSASEGKSQIKSALEIIEEYKGTEQANLAYYYAGVASLKSGKFDDAIDYLIKFDGKDDIIGAEAIGMIGDAYSEKGPDNYTEAVKYYEKAASHHANGFTTPYFLMKAGGVYDALKQYKKALNCYELIKKDYPKSEQARNVDKYLERSKILSEQGN